MLRGTGANTETIVLPGVLVFGVATSLADGLYPANIRLESAIGREPGYEGTGDCD